MLPLTPEQEETIAIYREKWRRIARSCGSIDQTTAAESIRQLYIRLNLPEPEIRFCSSPYEAGLTLWNLMQTGEQLGAPQGSEIIRQLETLCRMLEFQRSPSALQTLREHLQHPLARLLETPLCQQLLDELQANLGDRAYRQLYPNLLEEICPESMVSQAALCDFCFSVLDDPGDRAGWDLLYNVLTRCGWVYPFEQIVLICDRPCRRETNAQQQLQSEGRMAIEYADGFGVYAYQGIRLPEKYGKLHPNQWRGEWLLSEKDYQLRKIFMCGIGYDRLLQELPAVEFDAWQNYTLFRIDAPIDVESVYLLKRTCLHTGYIDIIRVPRAVESAKEALSWVKSECNSGGFPTEC
jgi:hypothetical protein